MPDRHDNARAAGGLPNVERDKDPMAAPTFAALFLAHVLADYLLQTAWLVENKRRPAALGIHIAIVLVTMIVVTGTFSIWFAGLALAHLAIDLTKTFVLRSGLMGYVSDQLLHVASVIWVAWLAPDIWGLSPFSGAHGLPLVYLVFACVLFAARGGQYAVAALFATDAGQSETGVRIGWAERVALCACVAVGLPGLIAGVLLAKLAYAIASWRVRTPAARARLVQGTAVSLAWAAASALPLWYLLPYLA
ncbi:MAG: DUF3307 domain-containing protein [Roseicyclus sp.]